MKVLPNGDYQLPSGEIVKKDEAAKLGRTAPKQEAIQPKKNNRPELQEGQSSGKIQLND